MLYYSQIEGIFWRLVHDVIRCLSLSFNGYACYRGRNRGARASRSSCGYGALTARLK